MAIVINTAPGSYYSAQGDLIFVVYEATKANDPVIYPDYKYVADIYIGSTQVARLKKVPQPDNKRGVFNIGDIIRSYVSANFNPIAATLKAQELSLAEFFIKATVKFGEEYSFVTYTNLTVDSERTYYNHYNGRLIGANTILPNYAALVASSRPLTTPVRRNATNCFIPYFATSSGSLAVEFKAYDEGNNLTGTDTTSVTVTTANDMVMINVAPPRSSVILTTTKYYTVKIGSTSLYTFVLTCEPRFDTYTIHFLNKLGGFETREFTKVSRKSLAITKTDFGRLPYTIDASGNVAYYNGNNVYNETRSTYASQFTEKLTLNTDILSDSEYTWLAELVVSPLVYIENGSYFIPVAITGNNYDFHKVVNDKLTNLTIDIEFGEQFNAQYR